MMLRRYHVRALLVAMLLSVAGLARADSDHGAAMQVLWPTTLPGGATTPIAALRIRDDADAPWSEVLALAPSGGGLELAVRTQSPALAAAGDHAFRIVALGPGHAELTAFATSSDESLAEGLLVEQAQVPLSPQAAALMQGGRSGPDAGGAKALAGVAADLTEQCPGGDCDQWLRSELQKWVKRLEGRPLKAEAALLKRMLDDGHVILDLTGAAIPLSASGMQLKLETDSRGVIRVYFNPGWPYSSEEMRRLVPFMIVVALLVSQNPSLDWMDAAFVTLGIEKLDNEKERSCLANFFQVCAGIAQHSGTPVMEALYGYWVASLNYLDDQKAAAASAMTGLRAQVAAAGVELKGLPSPELQEKGSQFGQALARFFELRGNRDWDALKSEFGLTDEQLEFLKKM